MIKKLLAEFFGTFLLVFFGVGSIIFDHVFPGSIQHIGIAFCFGLIVMMAIYTFGPISGAHINPAVSFGFYLCRKMTFKETLLYMLVQVGGGIFGALLVSIMFPNTIHLGVTLPAAGLPATLLLEMIMTAVLVFTILVLAKDAQRTHLILGLVVGLVVFLEALIAGALTGASMNPARSIGPAVVSLNFTSLWIYLLVPLCGAEIAAIGAQYFYPES